jgi:hypothetical protein
MSPLRTVRATALVPGDVTTAQAAVHELRGLLWPGATEVLLDEGGTVVHSVGDGPDVPDGWLTWSVQPATADCVRVTVALDEEDVPAPEPELDALLAALLGRRLASA